MDLCLRLKIIILETGAVDSGSSSTSSSSSFVNGATSKNLPAVQTVAPMPEDSAENMRYTPLFVVSLTHRAPSCPLRPGGTVHSEHQGRVKNS